MDRKPAASETWMDYFKNVTEVLHMDDEIVAFKDRAPKARVHILIVPRHRHIFGVEKLTPADIPLLEAMGRLGQELTNCETEYMGFHQHPFRSVPHLHLHCLVPPFKHKMHKLFFTTIFGTDSNVGYTTLTNVKKRLQRM